MRGQVSYRPVRAEPDGLQRVYWDKTFDVSHPQEAGHLCKKEGQVWISLL